MASHKPYRALFGGKQVDLPAGTFITGRFILAERFGVPPSTAWSRLTMCRGYGLLDTKSDNKRTVITICNWARYQPDSEVIPTTKPTTNRQPIDNQSTLSKEYKNGSTQDVPTVPAAVAAPKPPARKLSESKSPCHQIVAQFGKRFEAASGYPYRVTAKDFGIVAAALKTYPGEKLARLLDAYWDSKDEWILKATRSVGAWISQLNKLALPPAEPDDGLRPTIPPEEFIRLCKPQAANNA